MTSSSATHQHGSDDNFLELQISRDTALQAAREAVRDTTRLTRLFSILNDPGPLGQILNKCLLTLSELFMSDLVILFDPLGTGNFSPLASIGLPEDILQQPFSYKADSYLKLLLEGTAKVITGNTSSDTNIDPQITSLDATHVVGLPVEDNYGIRGVLILARTHSEPYTTSDIGLLRTMAYRIGRTLVEFQRSNQMEKVLHTGHLINSYLDFTSVVTEAVNSFPIIVNCDAALLIVPSDDKKYECVQQTGLPSAVISKFTDATGKLLNSTDLSHGKPFISNDCRSLLAFQNKEQSIHPLPGSLLAVPIHHKGKIQGVLFGIRHSPVTCNHVAVQIAMLYAEQISAALENVHLYQAVQKELKERKRLEEEQRKWERQQQQIQKANSLNNMAGGIAHHFNNMLAVVIGNLDLVADDPHLSHDVRRPISEALSGALKASEVSRLMLTYIGQASGSKRPLNLIELCQQSLPLIQATAPQNVSFSTNLPGSELQINGNSNQIHQVITNLLTNAFEACTNKSQAKVSLTVTELNAEEFQDKPRVPVEWLPEENSYASITIRDNGTGISYDDWDKIFVPFFSTKSPGRGLGLAVALGVVKAHGGCILLDSPQDTGGCTIRILLPLMQQPARHPAPADRRQETVPQKSGKILLVDDEDLVLKVTTAMLERIGYNVVGAQNGFHAIEIFKKHHHEISAVLCDISMPDMDGWQTTAAMRDIDASLPVILCSGHDPSQLLENNSSPVQDHLFLPKPFKLEALQKIVTEALTARC